MIIQKQYNAPLLNRKEIVCLLNHHEKPTPKKDEIKKEIAKKLNVNEGLIVIDKILTKYGVGSSRIFAKVYKTKKDLELVEKINKKKKEDGKKTQTKEQSAK